MAPSRPSKPSAPGGELSGLLKRAETLQKELEKAQTDLGNETVEGQDGSGMVSLRWKGNGAPDLVRIQVPSLSPAETRKLEEALLFALKGGMERLFELRRERLSGVTRGLNLPGLFS